MKQTQSGWDEINYVNEIKYNRLQNNEIKIGLK